MERELIVQGPHEELEHLDKRIIEKVIPRLLRPMESRGRKLKPSLVPGDLWHGNIRADALSNVPVLYDCGSFYGHNECKHPTDIRMIYDELTPSRQLTSECGELHDTKQTGLMLVLTSKWQRSLPLLGIRTIGTRSTRRELKFASSCHLSWIDTTL